MQNTSQTKGLFRDNALKQFNSHEDIQLSLKIIQPGAWLWLMILLSLLIGVMIWGVFGRISMSVNSSGIILPIEHIQYAEHVIQETLHDRKSSVMLLKNILDTKIALYKKHYLTLTDLERAQAEYVSAKFELMNNSHNRNPIVEEPLFDTDQSSFNHELYALVFVKNAEGKKILSGMNAYVLPKILSAFEYGYIKGSVESISKYPVSRETAYSYLGNMSLVDEFFSGGTPFIVKIRLEKNDQTISGLSWTTSNGAAFKIAAGTTVTAQIISSISTPLKYLSNSV